MDNNDMSRMMDKNSDIYYKVRSRCAEISARLKKRVTIRQFLTAAADAFLKAKDIDKYFK